MFWKDHSHFTCTERHVLSPKLLFHPGTVEITKSDLLPPLLYSPLPTAPSMHLLHASMLLPTCHSMPAQHAISQSIFTFGGWWWWRQWSVWWSQCHGRGRNRTDRHVEQTGTCGVAVADGWRQGQTRGRHREEGQWPVRQERLGEKTGKKNRHVRGMKKQKNSSPPSTHLAPTPHTPPPPPHSKKKSPTYPSTWHTSQQKSSQHEKRQRRPSPRRRAALLLRSPLSPCLLPCNLCFLVCRLCQHFTLPGGGKGG